MNDKISTMANKLFYLITNIGTALLRLIPEEYSHNVSLFLLDLFHFLGLVPLQNNKSAKSNYLLGLSFKNKLGLSAGLDKNGDHLQSLSSLGVGFIEIGTVTPKPQNGNNKPRLFRDTKNKSLINMMGFNNKGVLHLVKNLKKQRKHQAIVGVSIGKNSETPIEDAIKDYKECMSHVYEHSDYIAINISSPNTRNLRNLESIDYFSELISALKEEQKELSNQYGYVPLLVKISPDINDTDLDNLLSEVLKNDIDGVIATNTTTDHNFRIAKGGLSGEPLFNRSNEVLKICRNSLGSQFPLIASGGVMSKEMYEEKISLGADLVQIYTGLIYKGPKLIGDILDS